MTDLPWVAVEELRADHDVAAFTCGYPLVDTWFKKAQQNPHVANTQVCVDEAGAICAFFALRSSIVNVSGLPSSIRKAGDSEGWAVAIQLAWMGLHERFRGQDLGPELFFRAAQEAAIAYRTARIPVLTLDAAEEGLVKFYERVGMKRIDQTFQFVSLLRKIPPPSDRSPDR